MGLVIDKVEFNSYEVWTNRVDTDSVAVTYTATEPIKTLYLGISVLVNFNKNGFKEIHTFETLITRPERNTITYSINDALQRANLDLADQDVQWKIKAYEKTFNEKTRDYDKKELNNRSIDDTIYTRIGFEVPEVYNQNASDNFRPDGVNAYRYVGKKMRVDYRYNQNYSRIELLTTVSSNDGSLEIKSQYKDILYIDHKGHKRIARDIDFSDLQQIKEDTVINLKFKFYDSQGFIFKTWNFDVEPIATIPITKNTFVDCNQDIISVKAGNKPVFSISWPSVETEIDKIKGKYGIKSWFLLWTNKIAINPAEQKEIEIFKIDELKFNNGRLEFVVDAQAFNTDLASEYKHIINGVVDCYFKIKIVDIFGNEHITNWSSHRLFWTIGVNVYIDQITWRENGKSGILDVNTWLFNGCIVEVSFEVDFTRAILLKKVQNIGIWLCRRDADKKLLDKKQIDTKNIKEITISKERRYSCNIEYDLVAPQNGLNSVFWEIEVNVGNDPVIESKLLHEYGLPNTSIALKDTKLNMPISSQAPLLINTQIETYYNINNAVMNIKINDQEPGINFDIQEEKRQMIIYFNEGEYFTQAQTNQYILSHTGLVFSAQGSKARDYEEPNSSEQIENVISYLKLCFYDNKTNRLSKTFTITRLDKKPLEFIKDGRNKMLKGSDDLILEPDFKFSCLTKDGNSSFVLNSYEDDKHQLVEYLVIESIPSGKNDLTLKYNGQTLFYQELSSSNSIYIDDEKVGTTYGTGLINKPTIIRITNITDSKNQYLFQLNTQALENLDLSNIKLTPSLIIDHLKLCNKDASYNIKGESIIVGYNKPTIAYRSNQIGINTYNVHEDTLIDANVRSGFGTQSRGFSTLLRITDDALVDDQNNISSPSISIKANPSVGSLLFYDEWANKGIFFNMRAGIIGLAELLTDGKTIKIHDPVFRLDTCTSYSLPKNAIWSWDKPIQIGPETVEIDNSNKFKNLYSN